METQEARQLYYRVTGESFNENRNEKEFMPIRGGAHVGQRIEEIHLEESRLDGILEPEFGTGYVEWTMVFRNDHRWNQHEARMLISIPTGGVASRVTLWVSGEPREAAFGSKAKVRAADQSVAVRQRRDPILVNWAGPDRLLAQCFPIEPDGGKMKVRIGISFPLEAGSSGGLTYRYPTIVAENFNIDIVACLTSRDYNALYELAPLSYNDTLRLDGGGVLSQSTITFESIEDSHPVALGSSHAYRIWFANQVRTMAGQTLRTHARNMLVDYHR